ncbi:hypothetical protein [Streptomyces sp. NPDC060243]|uniref:hypothetical protein n=1 Tax=Streptomyces sp. NPDC060243 TaxID=3347081 RepID=UPI0036618354
MSASPASAAYHRDYGYSKEGRDMPYIWGAGEAYFQPYGEVFGIRDNAPDGVGVALTWWNESTEQDIIYGGGASDSYKTYDMSFPEGENVGFQVCLETSGTIMVETCGTKIYTKA